MSNFWKSSPKELFAWMDALIKRRKKNDNENASEFWQEGEY